MYPIADQYGKDKYNDILRHVEKEHKRLYYSDFLTERKPSAGFLKKSIVVFLGFVVVILTQVIH